MTTPTPQHGAMPELPPYPSNISHVTRRIRACEGETAAQVVLEYAMREYARTAIADLSQKLADMTADYLRRHREVCELKYGSAASPTPPASGGSSDHLAACDRGGVTQPVSEGNHE